MLGVRVSEGVKVAVGVSLAVGVAEAVAVAVDVGVKVGVGVGEEKKGNVPEHPASASKVTLRIAPMPTCLPPIPILTSAWHHSIQNCVLAKPMIVGRAKRTNGPPVPAKLERELNVADH
jgi:hypothetical protein